MKEALGSSETSVLTRATRRNIPEDTILHSHCHENLKSYIVLPWQNNCSSAIFNIELSEQELYQYAPMSSLFAISSLCYFSVLPRIKAILLVSNSNQQMGEEIPIIL
jgi:hypothetical protein